LGGGGGRGEYEAQLGAKPGCSDGLISRRRRCRRAGGRTMARTNLTAFTDKVKERPHTSTGLIVHRCCSDGVAQSDGLQE
jgi:hypothetical protein